MISCHVGRALALQAAMFHGVPVKYRKGIGIAVA
jgi:hypothetical protein